MNQPQLFQHFETLAETPESPAKLHELVLQLAVRGLLLPQSPNDSSAQKIADVARKLADAELPAIDPDDAPFELPKGWAWLRIGEAMWLINGRAFKPSDWSTAGLPIVRIQNLNNSDAPFNYCDFEVNEKVLIHNDDFLISWSGTPGTSFGAFIWNQGTAVLNQHIFRAELIGDAYDKRFLRIAINGRLDEMIAKAHGGVGLQHITKGKLERIILPVPPLAEQRRIVEKVEELQALCDELETRQTNARENRARLVRSALEHLTTAKDEPEFRKHSIFVLQHSDLVLDSVPALRQAILSLAVQGKLGTQAQGEEVASSIREIRPQTEPFATPANWRWTEFGEVAVIAGGFAFKSEDYAPSGVFVLRVTNIEPSGTITKIDAVFLPKEKVGREIQKFYLNVGDILLVMVGGSLGKIGIVTDDVLPALLNQNLWRITPANKDVDNRFLKLLTDFTVSFQRKIIHSTHGHLSRKEFRGKPIALPPLAEQQRIVAKVDELMHWCDALEARLTAAQTTATHLLDATLHQLLLKP